MESIARADLIHPKERKYLALVLGVSALVYAWVVLTILKAPATLAVWGLWFVIGTALYLLVNGLATGFLRGNAVRITEAQMPDVYAQAVSYAAKLGMPLPSMYVMQAGGIINAFAMRFIRRNFVVIYSDIFELARMRGEDAVGFVLAHELGHVWRGHVRQRWLLVPGLWIPLLAHAYSRGREYTCDRVGAYCSPRGAVDGLLVLAVGKHLYSEVDAGHYVRDARDDEGFWVKFAEKLSTHPHLPHRIRELENFFPDITRARGPRIVPEAPPRAA